MNLQELKQKNPAELISEAEKLGIENPSTLRKQEILFAILKKLAQKNDEQQPGCIIDTQKLETRGEPSTYGAPRGMTRRASPLSCF